MGLSSLSSVRSRVHVNPWTMVAIHNRNSFSFDARTLSSRYQPPFKSRSDRRSIFCVSCSGRPCTCSRIKDWGDVCIVHSPSMGGVTALPVSHTLFLLLHIHSGNGMIMSDCREVKMLVTGGYVRFSRSCCRLRERQRNMGCCLILLSRPLSSI